jgi:hypothetical protein
VLLTAKGLKFLKDKNVLSNHARYVTNKTNGPIFVSHDLLVNWFFIHLIQIGRENPSLSTKHLTISSHRLKSGSLEKPLLMERISNGQSAENYKMIPDGVFIITDKESEKSLLFFLEVDMGTETLVNSKGKPTDVRQKIVNYQALFRTGQYKRYEKIFNVIYSFRGEFSFDRTGFAAGTAISVIPVLIVFFIFQNYFVSGLSGAVKG